MYYDYYEVMTDVITELGELMLLTSVARYTLPICVDDIISEWWDSYNIITNLEHKIEAKTLFDKRNMRDDKCTHHGK